MAKLRNSFIIFLLKLKKTISFIFDEMNLFEKYDKNLTFIDSIN